MLPSARLLLRNLARRRGIAASHALRAYRPGRAAWAGLSHSKAIMQRGGNRGPDADRVWSAGAPSFAPQPGRAPSAPRSSPLPEAARGFFAR